jgi:hypothetical protein
MRRAIDEVTESFGVFWQGWDGQPDGGADCKAGNVKLDSDE